MYELQEGKEMRTEQFAFDNMYVHGYGRLDKTVMQSKTVKTLMLFIINGMSRKTPDWNKKGEDIVAYWLDCEENQKVNREISQNKLRKRPSLNDENKV